MGAAVPLERIILTPEPHHLLLVALPILHPKLILREEIIWVAIPVVF